MEIIPREPMALPTCDVPFPALAPWGTMGRAMRAWRGWELMHGPSPTTGQVSLDPMSLVEGEMATQASVAPHGAWRQGHATD